MFLLRSNLAWIYLQTFQWSLIRLGTASFARKTPERPPAKAGGLQNRFRLSPARSARLCGRSAPDLAFIRHDLIPLDPVI